MKVNYQEVREAIAGRQNFKGNSCQGVRTFREYYIKSYDTIIYAEDAFFPKGSFDTAYYSPTTSRIQGIIAEVIYGKTLKELRKEKAKAEANK